ncbi:MAG: phosphoribulokinase, partial [Cyanobacteria bacterium]|nr:phosphoribulokinase [Cyanobacteriota bacterium]
RAQNLSSSQRWKQQQEDQMLRDRGVALDAASLQGFVRMILSAIPAESFQRIKADVCFEVDPDRRLRRIRTREQRQDSLSSVSLTG